MVKITPQFEHSAVVPIISSFAINSCLQCGKDFHLLTLEVSPGWHDLSGIRSICHDYQAYRREVGAWLKSLSNRKVKHFQRFIPRILVDEPHYTDFSSCQTEV